MAEKIRIVLADDHSIVRRGLISFLGAFDDLEVIGDAASGEEMIQNLEQWLPDVMIMDLHMPGGMDGIEAIHQVRTLTGSRKNESSSRLPRRSCTIQTRRG